MFTQIHNHRRHRQGTRQVLAEHRVWWQDLTGPDFREELGLLHGSNRQHSNQVHEDRFAGASVRKWR